MTLYSEIFEQADVAERILLEQRENVEKIAHGLKQREINFAFLAARGT